MLLRRERERRLVLNGALPLKIYSPLRDGVHIVGVQETKTREA